MTEVAKGRCATARQGSRWVEGVCLCRLRRHPAGRATALVGRWPREPPCGARGAPADAGAAPHAEMGRTAYRHRSGSPLPWAATRASEHVEGWSHARRRGEAGNVPRRNSNAGPPGSRKASDRNLDQLRRSLGLTSGAVASLQGDQTRAGRRAVRSHSPPPTRSSSPAPRPEVTLPVGTSNETQVRPSLGRPRIHTPRRDLDWRPAA